MVSWIAAILAIATVCLIAIGGIFQVLNFLLDESDKAKAKRRVEDFWIKTATLGQYEQLKILLRSRLKAMNSLKAYFVYAFWSTLVIMSAVVIFETLTTDTKDIQKWFDDTIVADIDFRSIVTFELLLQSHDRFYDTDDRVCRQLPGKNWSNDLDKLSRTKSGFVTFIDRLAEKHPFQIRLLFALIPCTIICLLAVPLTLSLLFSFNVTIWLLSRVVMSKLWFAVIVIIDVGLALLAPSFTTSIMTLLATWCFVMITGGIIDYAAFDHATVLSTIAAQTMTTLDMAFVVQFLLAWFILAVDVLWVQIIFGFIMAVVISVAVGYARVFAFPSDVWKVLHGDFSPSYIDGAVNWAMVVDIAFASVYLMPALAMVLVQRHPGLRRVFLRLVQWVAEHPSGVFVAVSECSTAAVTYVRNLLSARGDS
jgi:hypothetical protein